MRVSQVLKKKGGNLITAQPEEPIWGVLRRYRTNQIGVLVVVDDHGELCGLLGERDLLNGLINHGRKLLDEPVSEVMTTDVPTCGPDDAIELLEGVMTTKRTRHVPVVENGRVTGIISIGDVVKARLDDEALENKVLRDIARSRR